MLRFASNELETIVIHRADILHEVEIWAPNLTSLSLQESKNSPRFIAEFAEINNRIRRDEETIRRDELNSAGRRAMTSKRSSSHRATASHGSCREGMSRPSSR